MPGEGFTHWIILENGLPSEDSSRQNGQSKVLKVPDNELRMSAKIVEELDLPFEIVESAAPYSPVVCNSPHSGRSYPAAFLAQTRLELAALRRSEDTFVDELFGDSVRLGVPMMRAHFPRSFLDVNREP